MSSINYSDKIPNNVNLSEDRKLQRALESWQPHYIDWWKEMGPEGTATSEIYLRTAISAEPDGWAVGAAGHFRPAQNPVVLRGLGIGRPGKPLLPHGAGAVAATHRKRGQERRCAPSGAGACAALARSGWLAACKK